MGLNAFFVYTVCLGLGFTWQQTLSMVFICGLINILITVTSCASSSSSPSPAACKTPLAAALASLLPTAAF